MTLPIIIGIILLAVFIYFVVIWVIKAHRKQVSAGREDLVGKTALVETVLNPKGIVLVEGERWTAALDSGKAEPGEEVIVSKVDGLKLYVNRK